MSKLSMLEEKISGDKNWMTQKEWEKKRKPHKVPKDIEDALNFLASKEEIIRLNK